VITVSLKSFAEFFAVSQFRTFQKMQNFCIAWSVCLVLTALLFDIINVLWLVAAFLPLWTHVYLKYQRLEIRKLTDISEPILAVVNDKSGSGTAGDIWKQIIGKISGAFTTDNPFNIGMLKWSKIVCVGGDGTIHRVCQELVRLDQPAALLVVPVGSSNGIATSLGICSVHDATEPNLRIVNVPLMVVQSQTTKLFGVMSVGWGFIADYDFYAENSLRWLGKMRDFVVPAILLARHRTYSGEVILDLHKSDSKFQSCGGRKLVPATRNPMILNSDVFRMVHVVKMSHITQTACMYYDINPEEDILYAFVIRHTLGRLHAARMFNDMNIVSSDRVEIYACTRVQILPSCDDGNMCVDGESIPCKNITIDTGGPRVRMYANNII
jgi:diacylglycerol kinase family enzyme